LPLGAHFTATGNFNLNMMSKIKFKKIKVAYGRIQDIMSFHIHVRTSYNSLIKSYVGYTVFPVIDPPPGTSTSLV